VIFSGWSFAFLSADRAHGAACAISPRDCSPSRAGESTGGIPSERLAIFPRSSNTIARELVVPWSSASTYFMRRRPVSGGAGDFSSPRLLNGAYVIAYPQSAEGGPRYVLQPVVGLACAGAFCCSGPRPPARRRETLAQMKSRARCAAA